MTEKEKEQSVAKPGSGNTTASNSSESNINPVPTPALPKGGGVIKGIDEKFSANPVTGTGLLTIPIFTTPGRAGFYPKLVPSLLLQGNTWMPEIVQSTDVSKLDPSLQQSVTVNGQICTYLNPDAFEDLRVVCQYSVQ